MNYDQRLRRDALAIWLAGVAGVRADLLVRQNVRVAGDELAIGEASLADEALAIALADVRRIVVVGAGKAGAAMAGGLEQALGQRVAAAKQLTGWVNVPADCVRPLARIHLHAARQPGANEPTAEGVRGTREIVKLVEGLQADDLCIALISGGGSALLPLPIAGITLDDKLAVTRFLSAAGAPIEDLNTVRKQLSQIKGGGLARACSARQMIVLVVSDVLGDPLDVIASGPTAIDPSTPQQALEVLARYGARAAGIAAQVFTALEARVGLRPLPSVCEVAHVVIGNNAVAVDAAGVEAERLGYSHAMLSARHSEGPAEEIGRQLAEQAVTMRGDNAAPLQPIAQATHLPNCLISGGEPTVRLVPPERRGKGGRNQQLVLAAAAQLWAEGCRSMTILSAGTDGEDGPTDAAGAFIDQGILAEARRLGLDPAEFLARNDAYSWFERVGGLIRTGPTDTNVCDVRVVLVDRPEQ